MHNLQQIMKTIRAASHSLLWLIFLLITLTQCIFMINQSAQLQLDLITSTNSTIFAPTTYSLQIRRFTPTPVLLNSKLKITFSSQYIGLIAATPTCSSTQLSSVTLSCSYSGNILYVSQLYSISSYLSIVSFTLSVSNIINPFPANDYTPVTLLQILAPNNAVIDTGYSSATLTINPAASTCSISILNPYAFQQGQITITYISSFINTSSTGFSLTVQLPNSYPDDITATIINPSFSLPVSITSSMGINYYDMNFVNSFTITMLMPPSSKSQVNIIDIFAWTSLGIVDQCSLSISNIKPNVFTYISISTPSVQTVAAVSFNLELSTPLLPSDILQINFDAGFNLASLAASTFISSYGTRTISRMGNLLTLSGIAPQAIINAQLLFDLSGVGLPFTTTPLHINISLLTSQGYQRILQNYIYTPSPGNITGTIACLTYQIGSTTSCTFIIKTSSYLPSGGLFEIGLPHDFVVEAGSMNCGISGSGLNAQSLCLYFSSNNTVQVGGLSSGSSNIPPSNINLTVILNISKYVGNYQIGIMSLTNWATVDNGSLSITTIARQLKTNELILSSSSFTTYSPTQYTLIFKLPFDLGYLYTVTAAMPFDLQPSLSPSLSGATLQSFNNGLLTFTSNSLSTATILLSNLMTYVSLQPKTLSVNVTYQGLLYFYGSQTITMTSLKQFSYIQVQYSNQIVYSPFIATITLSQLSIGDKIYLSAPFNYFYLTNQSSCSSAIVSCGFNGVLTVNQISSISDHTTFTVGLMNIGYVGQYILTVTVNQSLLNYGKQRSTYNLATITPNIISIYPNQTNPYLNQVSTYTFNLSLTTPNASTLLVVVSNSFIVSSVQCLLNCGTYTKISLGYVFPITSVNVIVTFTVTNPTSFGSQKKFVFKSSSSQGDMDYGQWAPQAVCNAPCRSCLLSNLNTCISCYNWQSLDILLNNSCVSVCPDSYFLTTSSGLNLCQNCDIKCKLCMGSSTNCSTCASSYFYYNLACYSSCPQATYTLNASNYLSCQDCQSNCTACSSPSTCTHCIFPSLLYNGSCLSMCPAMTYNLNSVCVNCNNLCTICNPSNGSCSTCISNYYLYNQICWAACPAGVFIMANNNICQTCQAPCSSCSITSTNCTGCLVTYNSVSYYYLSNACYSDCPATYYISSTSNNCIKCPSTCFNCSINSCLSCSNSMWLYTGSCFASCPNGSYAGSSSNCLSCPSICSSCLSNSVCTSCITNYYLFNSTCILQCPTYYYANQTGQLCLQCNYPCLLCNYSGCLNCANSSHYLQNQLCTPSCNLPKHPNNLTMICQLCQSPCLSCSYSNLCTSCITGYSLMNLSCLFTCPSGYYSDGSDCRICPSTCITCSYSNLQVSCTSCVSGNYMYGYDCISTCPNTTKQQGQFCLSSDCTTMVNCLSCSSYRCIQCTALYSMDTNQICSIMISSSAFINAISQIPVPFPFLIATIMIIILSFFLKYNFTKMYSPLFIYSLVGLFQSLCLILWTVLAVLWNQNIVTSLPIASIVNAPVVILFVYFVFNVVQFIFWWNRIATDRKYRQWQKQDNRSSSISIALISLAVSFRFDVLKYSKVGHYERLSARLQSTDKFRHYSQLAILSTIINVGSIVVSIYISSLQTSLNYLFFTGLQVTIMSVIMILLNIVLLCVPKDQLLELKQDYQFGVGFDQLEGKSVQELMQKLGVIEEEHDIGGLQDATGHQVLRKNKYQDQSDSQDLSVLATVLKPNEGLNFSDQIYVNLDSASAAKLTQNNRDDIFAPSVISSDDHILINQIEDNRKEAINLSRQYVPMEEQKCESTYPRQIGSIMKQRVGDVSLEEEESEEMEECQEYDVDMKARRWKRKQVNEKVDCLEVDEELVMDDAINNLKEQAQQQKINMQQEEKRKKNEQKQRQQELQKQKNQRQRVQRQIKKQEQEKKRQELQAKQMQQQLKLKQTLQAMKKEQEMLKIKLKEQEQEQIRLKEKEMQQQKWRQQKEEQKQRDISRREIYKLNMLNTKIKQLENQENQLQHKVGQLQNEELSIQKLKQQREQQANERVFMMIQDKLSKTAEVFYKMWEQAAIRQQAGESKSPRRRVIEVEHSELSSNNFKSEDEPQFNYHNNQAENLKLQASPRKIKVNPKPSLEVRRPKHLYVQEGNAILSDDGQQQLQEQIQILWNEGDTPHEDPLLHKPSYDRKRIQTAKYRGDKMENAIKIQEQSKTNREKNQNKGPSITAFDWSQKNKNVIKVDESLKKILKDTQERKAQNTRKMMPIDHSQEPSSFKFEQYDSNLLIDGQEEGQQVDFAHFTTQQKQNKSSSVKLQPQPEQSKQLTFTQQLQQNTEQNQLTEQLIENMSQSQNEYIHDQQLNQQIGSIESSARSIRSQSQNTHWPIQPEMKERIEQIQKRAEMYILRPKIKESKQTKKYVYETPAIQIYQQQQQSRQSESGFGQIVFQQSEQITTGQQNTTRSNRSRYPKGRVNRTVIDLSPQK